MWRTSATHLILFCLALMTDLRILGVSLGLFGTASIPTCRIFQFIFLRLTWFCFHLSFLVEISLSKSWFGHLEPIWIGRCPLVPIIKERFFSKKPDSVIGIYFWRIGCWRFVGFFCFIVGFTGVYNGYLQLPCHADIIPPKYMRHGLCLLGFCSQLVWIGMSPINWHPAPSVLLVFNFIWELRRIYL